jgi:hypothetical protein
MKAVTLKKAVYASALLLLLGSTANAATFWVNCGSRNGLTNISAALRALQSSESHGPATINVSGACQENIQIRNVDGLTLNGINGASITDTTNNVTETIGIYRANAITINGLTVNGGLAGINISMATVVLSGVTAQRADAEGVAVYVGGNVFIRGGTFQDNVYAGLGVYGADALVVGATTQRNGSGIVVDRAGRVVYRTAEPLYDGVSTSTPAIISYNKGAGALVQRNAQFQCVSCRITNNLGDGVHVDVGATVALNRYYFASGEAPEPVSITDNGGSGVSVGDLSSVTFPNRTENGIIQRNGGHYQISCNNAITSVTRQALLFATAGPNGSTNCTN